MRIFSLLLALLTFTVSIPSHAECVKEPQAYRMTAFRSPVPCTIAGGTVVTLEDLRKLMADGRAILVDVLPSPRRPKNLPEGTLWQPKERNNIPGSTWLPNTGFGELPVQEEVYLRAHLQRLTTDHPDGTLVFYCLEDCWMSWNAAKRAISWGYRKVAWFPEGTDAWSNAGSPLAHSQPAHRPE